MNVDFTYQELKYIASNVGMNSWQCGLAKTVEIKCRAVMPEAKRQEDIADKADRIARLKQELAELEKS